MLALLSGAESSPTLVQAANTGLTVDSDVYQEDALRYLLLIDLAAN